MNGQGDVEIVRRDGAVDVVAAETLYTDEEVAHYAAAVQGWDDAYADRNNLPRVDWSLR